MGRRLTLIVLTMLIVVGMVSVSSAVVRHIYIASTDGYVTMPDGTTHWIRGFVACNPPATPGGPFDPMAANCPPPGSATLPGPIIDVNAGDDVFIHMVNIGNVNAIAPADPHTVHLHGIHATTQNDGWPENSFEVPVPVGGVYSEATYYFYAEKPGTYMYHCHVEASEHVQMGMYGAMIIRPTGFAQCAPGTIPCPTQTVFGGGYNDQYDYEYVVMISDFDSRWHAFIAAGAGAAPAPGGKKKKKKIKLFNPVNFRPDYWLVNGRAFPDSIRPVYGTPGVGAVGNPPLSGPPIGHVPGSNNFVTYKGLIEIPNWDTTTATATTGPRVLVRLINIGFDAEPWHIHGWHFTVVGKDANPIPLTAQSMEYTTLIGSGETQDIIIEATKRDTIGLYAQNSPGFIQNVTIAPATPVIAQNIPLVTDLGCLAGSPYPSPNCAEVAPAPGNLAVQWFPMHNHDDYKVTNNGIYPGGQATLIYAHPGPAVQ